MYECKFFGTGPSSYRKRIYVATVSQKLRNAALGGYRANRVKKYCCISFN